MAERIRIQKAIANAGLMSRRAAEEAMEAGRVLLNGETVVLGDRVDPDEDILTVDGAPVPVSADLETYLLNKPVGVISSASDPQGRPTVVDLIESSKRLYPVGRLDADSEGLILVSNDGELTNRVTHPSFGVSKRYVVELDGEISKAALRQLRNGVDLDDGPARPESVRLVDSGRGRSIVEMVMMEGRNREVRRMLDAVGFPVTRLVRTAIGGLSDPQLRPGAYRRLTAVDIRQMLAGS
ncbi:MAG TPA: pseudouridine synthase [Acidimicrobiia bacterium]|nr:pseudouridine synthase [Acidimicrobiia bacterium]